MSSQSARPIDPPDFSRSDHWSSSAHSTPSAAHASAQPQTAQAQTAQVSAQVVDLLIGEALKEPRFARLIGHLEDRLRNARKSPLEAGEGRRQALSALRALQEDLRPLMRSVQSQRVAAAALLEQRQRAQAARLEASGQRLHQSVQDRCEALGGTLAELSSQLGSLDERLAQRASQGAASGAQKARSSRVPAGRIAGLTLVALLAAMAVGFYRFGGGFLPAAPTPWEQLWSQALRQPVLGCRESRGAQTFMACVCPSLSPSVSHLGSQCQAEPTWPRHQLIGALEAVLRVRQPDVVWVDWESGPELSEGLQGLSCDLSGEAAAARATLSGETPAQGRAAIQAEEREAAFQLLRFLQQHPSCAH